MAKQKKITTEITNHQPQPDPWFVRILGMIVLLIAVFLTWKIGWAQSSDWVEPATDIIDEVATGMQLLGGAVIGVGIIVVGIMAIATGRINWMWLIAIIVGGLFIFSGGAAVNLLLGQ